MEGLNIPLQADTSFQRAQAATGRVNNKVSMEQARASALEFEAVFISQMMQPMFEGVGNDPMFGGGQGEKMFNSMLVDEYGKIVSRSGGIGVADSVMESILKLQQVEGEPSSQDQETAK